MKRIYGLDLGTTSIGWAVIDEAENENEESIIIKTGVRVIPLTTDEENNFKEGKSITTNAERTLKRQARRNKHRYQLRRKLLTETFIGNGWVPDMDELRKASDDPHNLLRLRAKAANEKISLRELSKILLMINKKRGYKSGRKVDPQEGDAEQLIDEIDIAIELKEKDITPGQHAYTLLNKGVKKSPSYYRSDLINEYGRIWDLHKGEFNDILTDDFKELLQGRSKSNTAKIFYARHKLDGIKHSGKDKKLQTYALRARAISEILDISEFITALSDVNNDIYSASGYLGEIGDRSKQLHLQDKTVGELQYEQIKEQPHSTLKNQIFYRQDYMDEFDRIWSIQQEHHPQLTSELKDYIRDYCIFYQRPLKSKKSEIAFCEFESKEIEKEINGKKKTITIGAKVAPKSSPLYQEFKVWSIIHNIRLEEKSTRVPVDFDEDAKKDLFEYLNVRKKASDKEVLRFLFGKDYKNYAINYESIEGNKTHATIIQAYEKILNSKGDEKLNLFKKDPSDINAFLKLKFVDLGINPEIIQFDSSLDKKEIFKQTYYKLYHLLYSYQGDNSRTGIKKLLLHLKEKFGFDEESAKIIAGISFEEDYGGLSTKAMKKILPYLRDVEYSEACEKAGYKHSARSLDKIENENRKLLEKLEILPRNSLRNPVVEKILNQMIHVINALLKHPEIGRPDEIRIELARELKQNAEEREKVSSHIRTATRRNEEIGEILSNPPFNIRNASRNDVIKYKLYEELEFNGYKDLYTNEYISPAELFSNKYDIEHIIPKALVFDDSFTNKTLCPRDFNARIKGNLTAMDAIDQKVSDEGDAYLARVNDALNQGKISPTKHRKLLQKAEDLDGDFLARDLRNSQYIARKAYEILFDVTRNVTATTGKITAKLRADWGLMNIMKELNFEKYEALGLTYEEERRNNNIIKKIKDWTKRDDHRHHAMDALTVAFTRKAYVQYLNNKAASSKKGSHEYGIEAKYTYNDRGKRKFISPLPNFRYQAKKHLASILVSYKAKNKVVTPSINRIKVKGGYIKQRTITPRGQLHKETIYGRSKVYETKLEKINASFDQEKINSVAKKVKREALLKRLSEFGNDPKKAFTGKNSLKKNPIYINNGQRLDEKVKTVQLVDRYTIRKDIGPDIKLDKIVDKGDRALIEKHIKENGGTAKKALSDIENNPIWIDKKQGISLKKVTITGVKNAEPLHEKQDHFGKTIIDDNHEIPNDYISLGNNHHVAIYRDDKGKLQEKVVSFYEATQRALMDLPIIDKDYKKEEGWVFLFTLKQNEMFLFPSEDFNPGEIDLYDESNYPIISKHLFRVQKISFRDYFFSHHLKAKATSNDDLKVKELNHVDYFRIRNANALYGIIKIRLNHLGQIVSIGEY